MGGSFIRDRFTARKLLILVVSFVVALNMGLAAHFYFDSQMTDWQKNRPVDIQNGSGLTRAKAYADSGIVAGVSFVLCAGGMLLAGKIRGRGK